MLSEKQSAYKKDKSNISYVLSSRMLTNKKDELSWLKEVDACALQTSLKDLDKAYKNFFKFNFGYPKFKSKKDNHKSYRTTHRIQFLGNKIQILKVGKLRIKSKLVPQGRILNATISQEPNGHYYCSLCCADVEPTCLPKTNKSIGIDLGIVDFAILSDGTKIENPRFYEKSEKKLAKLQRSLSRKTSDGRNYEKARLKVARLYAHVSNQRKNFLHQTTCKLVHDYDIICIEDLDVKSMGKSDNSIKNKHIKDVSFGEFRKQLDYKCKWYGKELIAIDRWFPSSQICHVCGESDGKHDVKIRTWTCKKCGTTHDRDINASLNILNEGLRIRTTEDGDSLVNYRQ